MSCIEPKLACKTSSRADIPWFCESAPLVKAIYFSWQCCSWEMRTSLCPHLPPVSLHLWWNTMSFKRWAWKQIFVRIRNKALQGTNNIKILQTVRNWSNSSCYDVHNGHSMWAAIKNTGGKSMSMRNNFKKNHRKLKCLSAESETTTEKSLGSK